MQDPVFLMKYFDLAARRKKFLQNLFKYDCIPLGQSGCITASHWSRPPLQVEIHVVLTPTHIKASILLNQLRLIGVLDLMLELKSFVFDKLPEDLNGEQVMEIHVARREREREKAKEREK